jgi:hypothetical protein
MLRKITNRIQPNLNNKARRLAPLPKKGYDKFKSVTPIKTGNARNNTEFGLTSTGGRITGDYPYANRLNEGYSRQAPNGMTDPTIKYLRQEVKKVL